MKSENFFSSKALEQQIVNRKVSIDEQKINWLKIRSMIYHAYDTFLIEMFDDLKANKSVKINKKSETQFRDTELITLYPTGNKITKAKYDDLMV